MSTAIANFNRTQSMTTPSADDIIADLESRGLVWKLDRTGCTIEASVRGWPTVIARYEPDTVEPLAKMLATAAFDVDWTKYPVRNSSHA